MSMRLLSLFSGIGAFEKGLDNEKVDYELVNYCEIDKYASKSYCAIHKVSEELNLWDVQTVDPTLLHDVDLVTYGFPCTDVSNIGLRKGLIDENGNKTRSGLIFDVFSIIDKVKPKVAIAENVINLISSTFKDSFENILITLEQIGGGYNTYWKVLEATDYGIPQTRNRVFIVSIRKDIDDGTLEFPKPEPLHTVLADLIDKEVDPKYNMSVQMKTTFSDMTNRNGYIRGLRWIPHYLPTSKVAHTITTRQGSVPDQNYIVVGEPVYSEVESDEHNLFGEVEMKIDFVKSTVRRLTPVEAFRLMGFTDDDYYAVRDVGISDAQMYKMTGNSIVVPVVQKLLKNILKFTGGKE